ncbi:MAG: FAD-dependent oxidoreductase [Proteobacteria bacterium]|nr:MAG: FAD-dependent oxidoreductase [Pseudomonadota bacterium]
MNRDTSSNSTPTQPNDGSTDGSTLSVWAAEVSMPKTKPLLIDVETDVCIVGAGLGGITTAYLLQKEGKKVCVLEALDIGGGQTGRTTAQFSTALDDRYIDLEKYHGKQGAKIAAESHQEALNVVEKIIREEKIECGFKRLPGYLFRSPDTEADILEQELEAAHRAGLSSLHLTEVKGPKAFMKGKALCFPDQIQLQPLKYLKALAELILQRGGQIYTGTKVVSASGGKNAEVKTQNGFSVSCKSIVVATNSPMNDIFSIHTKQAPYRSYVVALKVPKGSVEEAFYWDTTDPYHYVRLEGDDLLVVGGEDHKTGQNETPEECFEKLEAWTRSQFPAAQDVVYRWSGQVMEPYDGMAYLGHNPLDKNNVYIITGDSGNGMTHCTIGGVLITDQIMGRDNPWEKLYHPSRVSPRATAEYLKENANVAVQYADWGKPHHSFADIQSLPADEGIIVRDGMKLLAVSKTASGEIEKLSAVCTHLGGIVHWNSVEKTWDCPCHGSRFDRTGKVVEGPAFIDLPSAD